MLFVAAALLLMAQERVTFETSDGGHIVADVYGKGPLGVVLAHGGRFNKESWKLQAEVLAGAGYHVLALDFRGYGQSTGPGDKEPMGAPLHLDVLGGVHYLRKSGAKTVSVIGGSLGGAAAADATVVAKKGEIRKLIGLGSAAGGMPPEKIKGRKLFIVALEDSNSDGPRLPGFQAGFAKMLDPKRLVIVDGSAHAQFLFQSDQAERVMREILDFLAAP